MCKCSTRLAPRTGQTLGHALLPVAADLPAGRLRLTPRHHDGTNDQLQPVEQHGPGAARRGQLAGSGPVERQQEQSEDAQRLGERPQRRPIRQELLCDVAVLRFEQPDQRGLRQRLGQHGLGEDLLHMHHADWRWAELVVLCGNSKTRKTQLTTSATLLENQIHSTFILPPSPLQP